MWVVGLRGIPDIEGGVERHAEHLYPRLARLGCEIDLIARAPYYPAEGPSVYNGVRIRRVWSPHGGPLEPTLHTLLAILLAAGARPDLVHIHAIGPSLFAPLARLFGLRVVVTHHGQDYEREKWGSFAKWVLRRGEAMAARYASNIVAISETIAASMSRQFGRRCAVIPNGVELPELPATDATTQKLGLEHGKYIVSVARMVPEKRQLDLIRAFAMARLPDGWKLALVGRLNQAQSYTRDVIALAENTPEVVLADYQTGEALAELYANAGIFVLPSSHEGLPIALLEALSFGLPVLASDIAANLDVGLPSDHYFPLGDSRALADGIERLVQRGITGTRNARATERRRWVTKRYDWDTIASQTLEVYWNVGGAQFASEAAATSKPISPPG